MFGFDLSHVSLDTIYWACLFIGLALMLVSLIFGEILDFGADTGHGPFSGPVIAAFLSFFGGVGLIGSQVIHLSALGSAMLGLTGSLLGSSIVYFGFYKVLLAQQGGTSFELSDAVGMDAQVFTNIPAEGTGEIVFESNSGRECRPARAIDGKAIPHNSIVSIERVVGGICFVRAIDLSGKKVDEKAESTPEQPAV
ncbi:hypothetical protein KQI84_19050 [bacterium]|nr:hypothetical protein [bacterium]